MKLKPPAELARLQAAFGRSIATPLQFVDDEGNYAIQFDRYDPRAAAAVCPRGAQSGAERIAVYNQQYWFRLLSVMQEEFPLTEALLGVVPFNELAMAYLDTCPPDSARLRDLSNRLEPFAAERVDASILDAIRLERIYIESFDAASHPTPFADSPEEIAALTERPLRFQPHFALFEPTWNVVSLRARLKDADPITTNDLEQAESVWAFWRGRGVQAVELGPLQAKLLRRLMSGQPLGPACEELAETLEDAQLQFLVTHVQRWFAAWSVAGWFADSSQRGADL